MGSQARGRAGPGGMKGNMRETLTGERRQQAMSRQSYGGETNNRKDVWQSHMETLFF